MKNALLTAALAALSLTTSAQSYLWSASFGGASSADELPVDVSTDADGNVYTAGLFGGTTDFDPGPGTFNITSAGLANICVVKQDASGNLVWAKAMTGPQYSTARSLVVDADKNVYVTGWFTGEVDFDPGPGTLLIDEGSTVWRDVFVMKLDSTGSLVWVRTIGAGHEDGGWGIALDPAGNLVVTGVFSDAVDFDPGAGTAILNAVNKDVFILKLDANGNFIWAKSNTTEIAASSDDQPYGICTDASGNIFITGIFGSYCDFDPGPGSTILIDPAGFDGFVQKLDPSGNLLWVRQLASTVVATGYYPMATASGGIVIPGFFEGTLDSDPGTPIANVTPVGMQDAFVMELDASGNLVWFDQMGSTGNDAAYTVVQEASGDLWVGGRFTETIDFDPGAGVVSLTSTGSSDGYLQHLSAAGAHLGVWQLGGTAEDGVFRLRRNGTELTACGYFAGTADLNPLAGVASHTAGGTHDGFTLRLSSVVISRPDAAQPFTLEAWPNPCTDLLLVTVDAPTEVTLLSLEGRILRSATVMPGQTGQIAVQDLSAGAYLLQARTGDSVATARIVKE